LLARHQCDLAVSVGPVGALDQALKVGDVVKIDRIIAHQRGSWKNGQFQQSEKARWQLELPERFPPDDWIKSLKKVAVASGELFVADAGFKSELRARTGADAVDMNLFGLQTALDAHGIGAIHLRVVSDGADETASEDFAQFVSKYDGALGKRVAQWINSLPADSADPQNYPELKKLLE
jgi:adenosylhomocysteine nucleosidase